jgi:thioesterase domain-containing protein
MEAMDPGGLDAAALEEQTRVVRGQIPLFEAMDLRIVRLAPGVAAVEAPEAPNINHAGMLYAGSLFSLAEVLGGLLPVVTWDIAGYVPIVGDVQIRFRRPAMGTIRATAVLPPEEVERVRTALAEGTAKIWFTVEASLTDTHGTEVATTSGKYVLLAMQEPPSADV